jgi:predicted nucleic acid-binding protein
MPAERLELATALEHFDRLLLDTCVLIDEFKKPSGRLATINRPQRITSVVSLWEFLHIRAARLPETERRDRRSWLADQAIATLSLTEDAGRSFEELMEEEGPTSLADALLAAQCLSEGVPLVTSNLKDFKEVVGLRYVAW